MMVSNVGDVVGYFIHLYVEFIFQVLKVSTWRHARFHMRYAAYIITLHDND